MYSELKDWLNKVKPLSDFSNLRRYLKTGEVDSATSCLPQQAQIQNGVQLSLVCL